MIERILDKIEMAPPSDCWHWTGAVANRKAGNLTPMVKVDGRAQPVRRVVFEAVIGEVPGDEFVVTNTCGNSDCVRPEHFVLRSRKEHARQGLETQKAQRATRKKFGCGHKRTPANIGTYTRKDNRRAEGYEYRHEYCITCKRATSLRWSARRSEKRREVRTSKRGRA